MALPASRVARSAAAAIVLALVAPQAGGAQAIVPAQNDTLRADPAAPAGGTVWVTTALGGTEELIGLGMHLGRERRGAAAGIRPTFLGRFLLMEEFCVFGCDSPGRHAEVSALLGGTVGRERWFALTGAAGVSALAGTATDEDPSRSYAGLGVPLFVELSLRPFSRVGLSGSMSRTFSGANLPTFLFVGLQFGDLHPGQRP